MFGLPRTATAPFCPSEVQGTLDVPASLPTWKRLARFLGPGLLVSVGYMDPGNWATDIAAGSTFGSGLLGVVVLSSLAAMVLQLLAVKLGVVARRDLAQQSRASFSRPVNVGLWAMAELAIVACDLAEVLGSALAFHLLLGVSLAVGVLLTALDTVVVLSLQGRGFRTLEAIVLGLVLTISACLAAELVLLRPALGAVLSGAVPTAALLGDARAWLLAVGIVGATVMPHNLYLHSSVVQTRLVGNDDRSKAGALRLFGVDTIGSLSLAMLVNAALLVLAAAAFHGRPGAPTEIEDAYHLLDPVAGRAAAIIFAVALLAAGQSSTFTGTIAGQVIMDGALGIKIPCWQRRLITRALALVPALVGVLVLGDGAVGRMLVWSQVVLGFQLPFAIAPLLLFTGRRDLMGRFANGPALSAAGWGLFAAITAANGWLLVQVLRPGAG